MRYRRARSVCFRGLSKHQPTQGRFLALSERSDTAALLSDAQFAGSSSVPAHVEMMGLIGMGNNPMVGATVSVVVAIEEAMNK